MTVPSHQDPDPEVGKTQAIRLFDVYVLGPAMVYAGLTGRVPRWMQWLAVVGGILAVTYNSANYARLERVRGRLLKP